MTHLRKLMLEELERRNYAAGTIRHYLRCVEQFAQHFGKSPEKLGLEHVRSYQAYLLKQRKLDPASVENHISALRFFFVRTLAPRRSSHQCVRSIKQPYKTTFTAITQRLVRTRLISTAHRFSSPSATIIHLRNIYPTMNLHSISIIPT